MHGWKNGGESGNVRIMTDESHPPAKPPPAPPAEPLVPPAPPAATPPATALTPEEQMALFEKELKETDWGHQPC